MTDEKEKKEWNAMVYLAGENNLAEECIYALKELKRAAPRPPRANSNGKPKAETSEKPIDIDKRVKVVAQLDAGGLGGNEARYVLKRGDRDGKLVKDEVTQRDTSETTYRGVIKDFISSSITLDGLAERYLVILSGHGNGLISDFLSRDVETPDKLSIPKLQWVFREVRQDLKESLKEEIADDFKIDVLGLDSCMMSMAEIGYELRHYVKYMVGAEGFEPNTGWPYERIMSDILTRPEMRPEELVLKIITKYIDYYTDFLPAGRSVDQSACDLSRFDDLAPKVKNLAAVLSESLNDPESLRQIVLAHWEAQSYKEDQYVDLYDFCDLLDRGPQEGKRPGTGSKVMRDCVVAKAITDACREVKQVLAGDEAKGIKPLVLKSCYSGPAVQYSHGLSIYFPWSQVIDSYKDLEFANDTDWKDFLVKYVAATRREKRMCPSDPEAATIVKGQLVFNPLVSGFDFLLTSNKDHPDMSRVLSNKVGTMKNPAIDHVPCKCVQNGSTSPDNSDDNKTATKQERTKKRSGKAGKSKGTSKK